MFVIVCVLVVAVNAALIVAVVRFRERRGREPVRFAAGRGALRPVLAGLGVLALAVFVYGVVRTDDARELEPAGPNGLGVVADRPGRRQGGAAAGARRGRRSRRAARSRSPARSRPRPARW